MLAVVALVVLEKIIDTVALLVVSVPLMEKSPTALKSPSASTDARRSPSELLISKIRSSASSAMAGVRVNAPTDAVALAAEMLDWMPHVPVSLQMNALVAAASVMALLNVLAPAKVCVPVLTHPV